MIAPTEELIAYVAIRSPYLVPHLPMIVETMEIVLHDPWRTLEEFRRLVDARLSPDIIAELDKPR